MVAEQFGLIVGVTGPLKLHPPARADQGKHSPHLVLEGVQPGNARPAQLGWLKPVALDDDSTLFRRAVEDETVDESAFGRPGVGLPQAGGIGTGGPVSPAHDHVHPVPVVAPGFPMPESQYPYGNDTQRHYSEQSGGAITDAKEPESGKNPDCGHQAGREWQVEVAIEPESASDRVVGSIGVGEAQFSHG